jgi:hypothetical protein
MQRSGIRKDIHELKRMAAFESKQFADSRIENMTTEELNRLIEEDIRIMGFESRATYYECAKKFILEKDEQANVSHEYAISKRLFELFKDFKLIDEFMLRFSSLELME